MKIIREKTAYIQFEDLHYLLDKDIIIPRYFSEELNEMNIISNNYSGLDSFIKFENEESIRYIESLDAILDYDFLIKLSEFQLFNLLEDLSYEKKIAIDKLHFANNKKKAKHFLDEANKYIHKYNQVESFIDYKRNNKPLELPKDVDAPKRKAKKNIIKMIKNKFVAKQIH